MGISLTLYSMIASVMTGIALASVLSQPNTLTLYEREGNSITLCQMAKGASL